MGESRPWLGEPGLIFSDAAAYADPDTWHEIAARIRKDTPLLRVERDGCEPFWAVTRHADVWHVERHAELFANAPSPVLGNVRPDPLADSPPVRTLVQMDGDAHRAHRALISAWFKPGSVRRLTESIDALARRSVDEMAARGDTCDFAQDVAAYFPLRVILSILGLPESDFPRMLRLTQELFGADDPDFQRIAEDDQMLAVIADFFQYFTQVTADRRATPGTDLASVIANAQIDDRPLDDLETFGFYLLIATAGHDTTSTAIAGGLLALLQHPDELARLRADPELIDRAADEIVRWVSPVKHFMRTAQEATQVGDTEIAAGDWLLLSYQSANRDELAFVEPFRFDVGRTDADRHLGFGFGAHYCLGAHLARLEIRAVFRELVSRLDHIELAGDLTFVEGTLVSGPKHLPVQYSIRS
ncbi:MAG TPA: cytochrome P450 [Acidimicrobiia bacterium]|nr:cytochrome P450 [Acidimicrobiia bacterium]